MIFIPLCTPPILLPRRDGGGAMFGRLRGPKSAIIIGGGVAGASIARELARKGVGVTLLEKAGQLCAGATWHAAGLVTRFGGSPKIKKVHVRALELMTEMHDMYDVGLHITGSIRLIETGNADRMTEAKQHVAMAALYDDPELPTSLISPEEVQALHPLVNVSGVQAGVYTPRDGDVDPTLLTTCIGKLAKQDGAKFVFNAEVDTITRREDGVFEVVTAEGNHYEADAVINAAGLWSRRFSRQLGLEATHPAYVIEHQYAITETIPELKGKVGEGERVPVLRDLAGSSYIRQERDGLLVGPYEGLLSPSEHTKVKTEWQDGPPARFAFDLFPPALDRLEGCLLSAMEVVPALGEVGFKSVVNGPTIWTGDSLARCGRTRLAGYYDFNSLTYGVAQSLALAEYLGHIITEGEQPYDMATEFDPLRYGGWATPEYTSAKVLETYSHNNSISYPHENRPAGRDAVAKSEAHAQLQSVLASHGALFGFSNAGIEVPLVFVPPGVAPSSLELKTFTNHAWAPYADDEAQHLLKGVGLGFASFSKLAVRSGASDAASLFLERVTTNTLPKRAGRCRLTYAPTHAGSLLAEFTVTRVGVDGDGSHDFYLCASRDYAQHDLAWLEQQRRALEASGAIPPAAVELHDITNEVEILHLAGPLAPALIAELCPEASAVPFLQMRPLEICGFDARIFRISFTGEAVRSAAPPPPSALDSPSLLPGSHPCTLSACHPLVLPRMAARVRQLPHLAAIWPPPSLPARLPPGRAGLRAACCGGRCGASLRDDHEPPERARHGLPPLWRRGRQLPAHREGLQDQVGPRLCPLERGGGRHVHPLRAQE